MITQSSGYEDCLSWQNAPVKVIRTGDEIKITAYVTFYGPEANSNFIDHTRNPEKTLITTYSQAIIEGIEKYWSGNYVINGKTVSLTTDVIEVDKSIGAHSSIDFWIENEDNGVCMTIGTGNLWSITAFRYVVMYRGYENDQYTLDSYMRTAAHEFGHVLGVDDAYGSGIRPESTTVNDDDMMAHEYSAVSPLSAWDVAMVMQAYTTNSWQYWESYAGHTQSSIIGYYVC
jgi:hypothetical protein